MVFTSGADVLVVGINITHQVVLTGLYTVQSIYHPQTLMFNVCPHVILLVSSVLLCSAWSRIRPTGMEAEHREVQQVLT